MNWKLCALAALVAAFGVGGAVGGGGIGGTGARFGTMRIAMTDAPSCHSAVYVTVEKVRLHASAQAADGDSGWSELVVSPAQRVNLVELTNGRLVDLGELALPEGAYRQLRLQLAPAGNSVVPVGGTEQPLALTPSAQAALRLNVDLAVSADARSDVVLDFDACRSVVAHLQSGTYRLKPVLTAIALAPGDGMRVTGQVGAPAAQVSLQADGVPVKATVADADGRYVLYPVPAGRYDLVVAAPGRATAVMRGVPVDTATATHVDAIAPGPSTLRVVNGSVTPASATVRALQSAGGVTFEAAWAPVDASGGVFAFSLPTAPVEVATWSGGAAPVFVPARAGAGKYTLEATSQGRTMERKIDASAPGAVLFAFP